MVRKSILVLLIALLAFLGSGPAAAEESARSEPASGAVLCAPRVQGDCLQLGPGAYIQKMEANGIHLPYEPLQARQPEPELSYLPYLYGQVVTPNAPVYGSIEDAAKAINPIYRMEGNFSYISYIHTEIYKEMRVYMIDPGVWMNALDVHRIGAPYFQGLAFNRTPGNPFGWILTPVETKRSPGYAVLDQTGRWLNRLEVHQVYDIEMVDGVEWLMVQPGEWIEKRFIGLVRPMDGPPPGVDGDRWVDVNLYEQTVSVYQGNRLAFATIISSGIDPFWTRPGLFQIREKLETTPMRGSFEIDRSDYYYLEDVPWAMYFDEARAFHGAYWHTGYGYPRSHGCVNMSPGDARWLFDWAEVGDWVFVHDPSGLTPTDPSLYTAGGA